MGINADHIASGDHLPASELEILEIMLARGDLKIAPKTESWSPPQTAMTLEEIGEITGMTGQGVRKALGRALDKLAIGMLRDPLLAAFLEDEGHLRGLKDGCRKN